MSVSQILPAFTGLQRWLEARTRTLAWRATLALACLSAASTPALADALQDAFQAARSTIVREGWTAQLIVVHDRKITVALGARYRERICSVFALRDSPYLVQTLAQLEQPQRRPYLEALFAHELGHCEEQHLASTAPDRSDELESPLLLVKAYRESDGALRIAAEPRHILWKEILADAYTGMYLRERHPAMADALMAFHLLQRASHAATDPEHLTSPYLHQADFTRQPGERWADAAMRLRRAGAPNARPAAPGPAPDTEIGTAGISPPPRRPS